jgi:hypothetical protein
MLRRCATVVGLLLAGMILAPAAEASLNEKPVQDDINDIIAVLHGLEARIVEIKRDLHTIRTARAVTQKQLDALRELVATEKAKGNETRAGMYSGRLLVLEKHMQKLNEFDFEEIFGSEIQRIENRIAGVKMTLEARIMEFRTLFGKEPEVNLQYQRELEQAQVERREAQDYIKYE